MIGAYAFAAVLIGALISVQPALNAMLAASVGSAITAATISIIVALFCAVATMAFVDRGEVTLATLTAVPWWVYLGGTVGMVFVAGGVIVAPVIGALLFFVCIVGGQLIGAMLADHFGAFGLSVRPISLARVAGLALVFAGAVLVYRG